MNHSISSIQGYFRRDVIVYTVVHHKSFFNRCVTMGIHCEIRYRISSANQSIHHAIEARNLINRHTSVTCIVSIHWVYEQASNLQIHNVLVYNALTVSINTRFLGVYHIHNTGCTHGVSLCISYVISQCIFTHHRRVHSA